MRPVAWFALLLILPTTMACESSPGSGPDLGTSPDLAMRDDGGAPDGGAPPDMSPPAHTGWRSDFDLPGVSGNTGAQVVALARGANGHVFAGGDFIDAAGTAARNIAEWTGSAWAAVGDGLADRVQALAVGPDGALYAGTATGEKNHVHRWDGKAWSDVAGELDGGVVSLAWQGSRLLVGGDFATIDGKPITHLGAWTPGVGWTAIGLNGPNDRVTSFVINDAKSFCMSGWFGQIDSVTAFNVACWDGNHWSQLGNGTPANTSRLIRGKDGTWYAGGFFNFFDVDHPIPGGIAFLDEHGTWQQFGGGVDLGLTTEVRALAFDKDGGLLVGGDFAVAGNGGARNLARYDFKTKTFSELGGGVSAEVGLFITSGVSDFLVQDDGSVLVGGYFSTVNHGATPAANIARWQGGNWSQVVNAGKKYLGLSGLINALAADSKGGIIAGGSFRAAGAVHATGIARFDGSNWSALGDGLSGDVYAVHVSANGDLIAGGAFGGSGTIAAPAIARWDGKAWSPFAGALDGPVSAIAEDSKGVLYIGGSFGNVDGNALGHVARWDGKAWAALGDGFDSDVTGLAVDADGHLVATGLFTKSGATAVNGLASWDGSKWSAFGAGLSGGSGYGSVVVAAGKGFIVGGTFAAVDGHTAHGAARWDGTQWSDAAAGLKTDPFWLVQAIVPTAKGYILGGIFQAPGDSVSKNIAEWDGTKWTTFTSGLNDVCGALLVSGKTVWAGGPFVLAGGVPSVGIAAWDR